MVCESCKSNSQLSLDCITQNNRKIQMCYICLMKMKTLNVYVSWPSFYKRILDNTYEDDAVILNNDYGFDMDRVTEAIEKGVALLQNHTRMEQRKKEQQAFEDAKWEIK